MVDDLPLVLAPRSRIFRQRKLANNGGASVSGWYAKHGIRLIHSTGWRGMTGRSVMYGPVDALPLGEGITRKGRSSVKNRNFIFEMVFPFSRLGRVLDRRQGGLRRRRRQQGARLATFPWNTDIHGRFIDKRGKARGDFYAGIKDRLQHTEKG